MSFAPGSMLFLMIMTRNNQIKLKKGDFFVAGILLLLCALLFFFSRAGSGARAEITVDGETVFSAELTEITEKKDITLTNGIVVAVEPGAVYFVSSPCKGHDCVKTGRLTRAGQCAVCLPMKTVIRIYGSTDGNAPDAIT